MFGLKGASSSPVLPIKNESLSDRFLTLLIMSIFFKCIFVGRAFNHCSNVAAFNGFLYFSSIKSSKKRISMLFPYQIYVTEP